MPRRGFVPKREVLADPIYGSQLVTKLINSIMLDGKKGVAQKVVYGAFDIVKEKSGRDPLEVFIEAMDNIMPSLEVKARRVGGATYQVPMEVRPERRQTLGLRWITKYSRARSERTMAERLAGEIMDAVNNLGGSVKKREDTHKMAEANKAFAHYHSGQKTRTEDKRTFPDQHLRIDKEIWRDLLNGYRFSVGCLFSCGQSELHKRRAVR